VRVPRGSTATIFSPLTVTVPRSSGGPDTGNTQRAVKVWEADTASAFEG
jgi:hypothetical protein